MRPSSPTHLVSRMAVLAAEAGRAEAAPAQPPAVRVKRIVWAAQAARLRASLPLREVHMIEQTVAHDLEAMELPEVFFTSVEAAGRVITCDLDSHGVASIFGMIDPGEYDDLVEEAGDDALFGVDWDGVYVTPARTRH